MTSNIWHNNKAQKILLPYEISKIYVICAFNSLEFSLLQQTIILVYNIRVPLLLSVLSPTTEHYPHHCTHNDNRASRLSHNPRNQEALMSDLTKRGRGPKEEDMNPKRGARFVGFSKKRVADKTRGIWHHHSHIITLGLLWSGCVKPFKKKTGEECIGILALLSIKLHQI